MITAWPARIRYLSYSWTSPSSLYPPIGKLRVKTESIFDVRRSPTLKVAIFNPLYSLWVSTIAFRATDGEQRTAISYRFSVFALRQDGNFKLIPAVPTSIA